MTLIVIVNFKGWADTLECLASALHQSVDLFKIVVIDNSPDDISQKNFWLWIDGLIVVDSAFPEITSGSLHPDFSWRIYTEDEFDHADEIKAVNWVIAKSNQGFAAANNIAIKYATNRNEFDFVWLLNNDAVAEHDALKKMIDTISLPENRKVGMLGVKVMEYFEKNIIQAAGGGRIIPFLCYPKLVGAGERDEGQHNQPGKEIDFIAGTSMFVRVQFIREIGLMNEQYFLYFEEPDWAARGRKKGWHLGYVPARVYHKGGQSTGGKGYSAGKRESTVFSDFYFQRAKILFALHHHVHWIPVLYMSFFAVLLNRIRRGQYERIPILLRILIKPSAHFNTKQPCESGS